MFEFVSYVLKDRRVAIVVSDLVFSSIYLDELRTVSLLKAPRKVLKPVRPFQKFKKISDSVSQLALLFKPNKISVVAFVRKYL